MASVSLQGGERWPSAGNPSAKLKARPMPPWIQARGSAIPPPPPPPVTDPPPVEPEYEVIDFGQTYSNQPVIRSNKENTRKRCDLCGSSVPAVRCLQCVQQNFCYSCDEMYHRHPKRQSHVRKELDGGRLPPLPPKGEPPPPPIPPPRRNKRATPRPVPPPHPGPHNPPQSVSPKPGLVGSLKRIIGVRPLPQAPNTLDRQASLPPSSSMMNFHDQQIMNSFPDWTEMHRGHRSGSFSTMNPSHFGPMMQAQSMAQLNCPSCHGHGMWNPWGGGMGPQGMWQSQNLLNQHSHGGQEEWSESDSDTGWQRERLRRFSTMSARMPRGCDDPRKGPGRRQDSDTQSNRGGRRRQDLDNLSYRGGRRQDFDTMSVHGGKRQEFDTMSVRGGKRQDFDTMSLRGGRRSDLESPSIRSNRKFSDVKLHRKDRHMNSRESDSSDERESDEDFIPPRGRHKVMSDLENLQKSRRRSEPPSPIPQMKNKDSTLKKKTKRNERFSDTGRRRSSPVQYKYESPSGEEEEEEEEPKLPIEVTKPQKIENGIEFIDGNPEEDNEEEELASIPDVDWECRHCTFVNEGGSRVCAVCCKTNTKPKIQRTQTKPQPKPQSPPAKLDADLKNLKLDEKVEKEPPIKTAEKTEKAKERRGTVSPEGNPRNHTTSTGTSPPPQSISTQTYEEGGKKLKRATSLADYSDWRPPQRSGSRQSLLSDTQSLPVTPPRSGSPRQFREELTRRPSDLFLQRSFRRAGSQPPEYFSSIVQKQVKQGLEMVKLLREAEEKGFSADELGVAVEHCGEDDPLIWLQENWANMVETVVTLGTNYGRERKENTVGTISTMEAREALTLSAGNVWGAVTQCVQQRQRKYAELLSRGNFSREDIVTVLTANQGNLEEAYKELNKNQLKPFLMRIWGPPQGADNEDGDFTKLAHGEMEGRGGKNSEEVSVDLSIDSNYERIETWLEEYVHTNTKSNISQSMFQMMPGGLKRSASDWKVNNPTINSRSNTNIFNDRRNTDIHKYLTNLYNANDKTLLIKKHSASTINLANAGKSDNFFLRKDETKKNDRRFSLGSKKSEGSNKGEPDTITIKLNPTIVKTETEDIPSKQETATADNAKESEGESNSKESESESEEESSEEEESHQINNIIKADIEQLKADIDQLKLKNDSFNETALVSESENQSSKGLSRSESQASSESFESVHSSVNDSELETHKKAKSELNKTASNHFTSADESLLVPSQGHEPYSSRESSSELESRHYENVNIIREQLKQQNVSTDLQITETVASNKAIKEANKYLENKHPRSPYSGENNIESPERNLPLLKKHLHESTNSSLSTNESEDMFEEVTSDEEIPFIEDASVSPHSPEGVQIRIVPVAEDEVDDLSENSNFRSIEVHSQENRSSGKIEKSNPRVRNSPGKSTNLAPNKRRVQAKRRRQYNSESKSDSDLNDERSLDYSEESVDYKEERKNSFTVTAKKRDLSLGFSEGNSDRDVSSIPTDSEKEHVQDKKKGEQISNNEVNKLNTDVNSPFQPHHAELFDLLKKSLTNDSVIERLVTTLFASVIQASVEGKVIKDKLEVVDSKRDLSQLTNRDFQKTVAEEETMETVNDSVHLEHITTSEVITYDKNHFKGELESMDAVEHEIPELTAVPLEVNNNEIQHKINLQNESIHQIAAQQDISEDEGPLQVYSSAEDIAYYQGKYNNEITDRTDEDGEKLEKDSNKGKKVNVQEEKIETVVCTEDKSHTELAASPQRKSADEELVHLQNKSTASLGQEREISDMSPIIPPHPLTTSEPTDRLYEESTLVAILTSQESNNIEENVAHIQSEGVKAIADSTIDESASVLVHDSLSKITGSINKDTSYDAEVDVIGDIPLKITADVTNEGNLDTTAVHQDSSSQEILTIVKNRNEKSNTLEDSENAATASSVKNKVLDTAVKIVIKTELSEVKKVAKSCASFRSKKKSKTIAQLANKFDTTQKSDKADNHQKPIPIPEPSKIPMLSHTLNSTENKEFSIPEDSSYDDQKAFLQKAEPMSEAIAAGGQLNTFNPEREARRLLAEGLVNTYQQAELVVQLRELHMDDEATILAAAKECSSLEAALAYLQQECQLCTGKYPIKQMVSMLECEHICCVECASNYFTLQITERSINDCVCPFCKEPDILHIEEDNALTYFSNLDIFLKGIVKENIHELFQRKLRDRTLMQDPNFKWCVKCSSGYIANPRQKRLMCPDCKAITCAKCMKPWEKEHEKMSCDEYKVWMEQNDPENQLVKHLEENGVTCPNCKSKYILAKGGCMHLTCPQCKHEFCSGCTKPFRMGKKCTVSDYCERLGLHAHHPRNCLFYLRDKEPEELEKLLDDNKIDFNRVVEFDTAKRCGIQMLKETSDGLVEGICGYAVVKAGLCRAHYIESLAMRVRQSKIDPVKLLDFNEAVQELTRHRKSLPPRPPSMSEFNYRQILYKVIEEEIPLD